MLEHVPEPERVVAACAALLAPGGAAFFSTINRNPKSFALAVVGAEYVLGLLPRGTHEYLKLIRPSELAAWCRRARLDSRGAHGPAFQSAAAQLHARRQRRRELLPARPQGGRGGEGVIVDAVLFDLDGTLADTAPDLVRVLNRLLVEHGRTQMPYAIARNEVSNGAGGLLRLGFGELGSADALEALRRRFLDLYAEDVSSRSRLFIELDDIDDHCHELDVGRRDEQARRVHSAAARGARRSRRARAAS